MLELVLASERMPLARVSWDFGTSVEIAAANAGT